MRLSQNLKKVIELESGQNSPSTQNSVELQELRQSIQHLNEQHEQDTKTVKNLEEINTSLKSKANTEDTGELTAKLKVSTDKITILVAEKLKLEGYLRTAKQMIREERSKRQDLVKNETSKVEKQQEEALKTFRNQIKEKDKEIAYLKNLVEESKDSSAREQKLMSSALFEVGLELQRMKAPKPDVDQQPKSLLAQKRKERAVN